MNMQGASQLSKIILAVSFITLNIITKSANDVHELGTILLTLKKNGYC